MSLSTSFAVFLEKNLEILSLDIACVILGTSYRV